MRNISWFSKKTPSFQKNESFIFQEWKVLKFLSCDLWSAASRSGSVTCPSIRASVVIMVNSTSVCSYWLCGYGTNLKYFWGDAGVLWWPLWYIFWSSLLQVSGQELVRKREGEVEEVCSCLTGNSVTRGKVLARSRLRSKSGTQTSDPCDHSLAFYLWAISTEVKVQPAGTDLILRFARAVIEQTLLRWIGKKLAHG